MGGEDFDCPDFDEERMTCTNPDCEHHNEDHLGECDFMWTKADRQALLDNYARRKSIIAKSKADVFVEHIQRHLTTLNMRKVICKICGKDIDTIFEEEGRP